MFCRNCGKQMEPGARFCVHCGHGEPTQQTYQAHQTYQQPRQAYQPFVQGYAPNLHLSNRLHTSAIFWLVITILQVLLGLSGSVWVLLIALNNGIATKQRFTLSQAVKTPYPTLIDDFDKQKGSIWFILILNLFLGGFIGVGAAIYDLSTRKYVLNNADLFQQSYQAHQTMGR